MENNGWSVVFEGKIATGRRVEEVKKNLAILFRTSTGKIEGLFAGPRTVIKRNLSHPAAMKYKKVLAHVGALCRIENAKKGQKSKVKKEIDNNPVPAGGAKGSMVCPLCSHEQDAAEECTRCGAIIQKFLEKKNRQSGDLSSVNATTNRRPKNLDPHKLMLFWALPLVAALIIVMYNWRSILPISLEPSQTASYEPSEIAPHRSGQIAPHQPVQINIKGVRRFLHKSYRMTPLATFQIEARVLSMKRYYFDRSAKLSPVDLALGWGPMSDSRVIEKIKISQHGRFYFWRVGQFPPIPEELIIQSSANMHIIPANKEIAKRLKKVRKGNVVSIKGYLVRVDGDNFEWQSSLTRADTGAGACEVVYAEKLDVT
jgi:hypothetical protein